MKIKPDPVSKRTPVYEELNKRARNKRARVEVVFCPSELPQTAGSSGLTAMRMFELRVLEN